MCLRPWQATLEAQRVRRADPVRGWPASNRALGAHATYAAGFGITWLLVKVVFLDALLHMPDVRAH